MFTFDGIPGYALMKHLQRPTVEQGTIKPGTEEEEQMKVEMKMRMIQKRGVETTQQP